MNFSKILGQCSESIDDSEQGMINNLSSAGDYAGNYCRWNLSVFSIEKKKNILDIGCGPGLYLDAILAYDPESYVATDYSLNFLDIAKKRMSGLTKCHAERVDILDADAAISRLSGYRFDYVLCLDVMEHLLDDGLGLKNIRKIMLATGAHNLFIRVPALPWVFGINDEAIGHFRRYTKKSLRSVLETTGFEVRRMRYQNIVGIIPWFMIGKLCKRALAIAPGEGRLFDRMVPLLRRIEAMAPPPIGLSLYCEAAPKNHFGASKVRPA
jgi:SAM-dependent methyltransferase